MIQRLLQGAESVISRASHCWLMTLAQSGGVNARPMGRVTPTPSLTGWNLCFLADSRSKKTGDIHSASQVRLIFEDSDDAFVSLAGAAEVISDTAIIKRRWIAGYDSIFPSTRDKAHAVFIDIRAEELRLWLRGLTPEPFGVRSATLRRPVDGDWYMEMERP
jgi:general stress protein 26